MEMLELVGPGVHIDVRWLESANLVTRSALCEVDSTEASSSTDRPMTIRVASSPAVVRGACVRCYCQEVSRLSALALALTLVVGCSPRGVFQCVSDDQCGAEGRCEGNGYCSFPDDDCPEGRRYGSSSAVGVADQCVEPSESTTSADATSGSQTSSAASGGETSLGTTADGSAGGTDSSASASGSTSSGPAPISGTDASSSSDATGSDTEPSTGTTGGPSLCPDAGTSCRECGSCSAEPGGPCSVERAACEPLANCVSTAGCLFDCARSDLCLGDCCEDIPDGIAAVAFDLFECQMNVCGGRQVCGDFNDPACNPSG